MPTEILGDPRKLISKVGQPLRDSGRGFDHHPVKIAPGFPNAGRVYALFKEKSDADSLATTLNNMRKDSYEVGAEIQIGEEYEELDGEFRAHGIGPYETNAIGVKGDVYHWERPLPNRKK